MQYKALALDLDGTLTNSNKEVSDTNKQAIRTANLTNTSPSRKQRNSREARGSGLFLQDPLKRTDTEGPER